MTNIKITVIIPTFRRPKLLINCLNALVDQTLDRKAFEIIVVSDGPDYHTQQLIDGWRRPADLQFMFLQTPVKKGPAYARNFGSLNAKSSLIAFTDDDCLPQQNWLLAFLDAYSGEQHLAFSGKTVVPMPIVRTDFANNLAQLAHADFITANCACTKEALLKVGGFDERFEMAWREDSDLEFKLIVSNIPIIKLPEALLVHPVRKAPWGISIMEQKKSSYDALLYKKFPELYKEKIAYDMGNYYFILLAFTSFVSSLYLHLFLLSTLAGIVFVITILELTFKRLKHSDLNASHIVEMLITSLAIPFLSIFWRLYGAVKYNVFFF